MVNWDAKPLSSACFKKLYHSKKARVIFNGELLDEIAMDNGVKRDDIPTPTLFSIYVTVAWFSMLFVNTALRLAFAIELLVGYLIEKDLIPGQRFSKHLYANYDNDSNFVAHTEREIQILVNNKQ